MKNDEGCWGANFEDAVTKALIACYETKLVKNKGAIPTELINQSVVDKIREDGPYLQSDSRYVEYIGDKVGAFDVRNDPLPKYGTMAVVPAGGLKEQYPDAYFSIFRFRMVDRLTKPWVRRSGGALYEFYDAIARQDGLHGERFYISVDGSGKVLCCDIKVPDQRRGTPGVKTRIIGETDSFLNERSVWSALALQAIADRRFCWVITAQETGAKAHLGCMKEEVKSLLYARNLPLTATGRKRPILHLVEAHHRRMQSGTDVDVTAFLRGQQSVTIGNTLFTVRPPLVIKQFLSENSGRYFESRMA